MSRDSSGNYTLPGGVNPVVDGTTITASWANTTLNDLTSEMTDSLDRSGKGGMLAVLKGVDGAVGAPAFSWSSDPTCGIYRAASGDVRLSLLGADVIVSTSTSVTVKNLKLRTSVAAGTVDVITAAFSPTLSALDNTPVYWRASGANTSSTPTLARDALAAKTIVKGNNVALTAGDIPGAGAWMCSVYDVTLDKEVLLNPASVSGVASVTRSYLAGCALSTAGASTTMSIAAGSAVDSTNVVNMALTATSKTTSAWALGAAAGGLDTGAIANSTWYHFYVIRRPDTGVVDVVFSTNATTPTLPTNYTQYRRIGSGKINGSAQWTGFTQVGDRFLWTDPVADVAAANPGIAAVTRTLTVPTGVVVRSIINAGINSTGGWTVVTGLYLSALTATDTAPLATTTGFTVSAGKSSADMDFNYAEVTTNTSAQIRSRLNASQADGTVYITTVGWVDTRGKDS